ncbi:MAG: alpha/beta fold hydrolase [Pseudomonadota bacterium]
MKRTGHHLLRVGALLMLASLMLSCVRHTTVAPSPQDRQASPATVVLLHGLGRGAGSMRRLQTVLSEDGYRVCPIDYPSTRFGPPELLRQIDQAITDCSVDQTTVHFVTHSLGGILIRAWAREHRERMTGRVVMLAPPNHGSELGDLVARSGLLRAVLGPTGADLGTTPRSFPNRQSPATFDVGVIAGTKSRHPIGSALLDGPNDGTVTVASARLPGMRDFATVHRAHSFIMGAPEVIAEVRAFLATGCFSGKVEDVSYDTLTPCHTARVDDLK